MKTSLLLAVSIILCACSAANPGNRTTTDLWSDYCATEGHTKDPQTRTTVQRWDSDATTAGHRGISTDDKLGPNPSTPPGC